MNKKVKILVYCNIFIAIFIVKMFVSTAPVIFDLDKKVVNAAIMQLELENNKEEGSEAKNINDFLKKGTEFIHVYDFVVVPSLNEIEFDYHYFSKKYYKTYFPTVPTQPPNAAC